MIRGEFTSGFRGKYLNSNLIGSHFFLLFTEMMYQLLNALRDCRSYVRTEGEYLEPRADGTPRCPPLMSHVIMGRRGRGRNQGVACELEMCRDAIMVNKLTHKPVVRHETSPTGVAAAVR